MTNTLFSAFVYKMYGPLVLGATPEKPSGLALPQKDNASFREAAQTVGVRTPLADAVWANLAKAIKMGRSHEDWLPRSLRPSGVERCVPPARFHRPSKTTVALVVAHEVLSEFAGAVRPHDAHTDFGKDPERLVAS